MVCTREAITPDVPLLQNTPEQFIPRRPQRLLDPADDIEARIGRAILDPLHIAPVDLRGFGKIVLRELASHAKPVHVAAKSLPGRNAHRGSVEGLPSFESGLIVAFLPLAIEGGI